MLTGGSVAVGRGGLLGNMPGVGEPGSGNTFNGVILGEGVMLGMSTRVGAGMLGSSLTTGVGGVGAPHNLEFPAQAVNRAVTMAIWAKCWNLFMGRRDYTSRSSPEISAEFH